MTDNIHIIRDVPPVPERPDHVHKGQVGRIVVIGGRLEDVGIIGAPAMTANAALRSGAGLVQVITPEKVQPVLGTLAPCATTRALPEQGGRKLSELVEEFGATVVAIGPGLDPRVSGEDLIDLLTHHSRAVVIDADGLNVMAALGGWDVPTPRRIVLTPHTGELHRIIEGWKIDTDNEDRRKSAIDVARATGAVVVHKGQGTVVTDGRYLYVNQTGNSGMATGGTGDILTGIIAGLLGQHMEPFEAAVLGVHIHGLAGDYAVEEYGRHALISWDLLEFLPDVFCELGE
jgi:NAD(P)H-hydrate epimerase